MSAGPAEVVRQRLEGSDGIEHRTIAAADVRAIPISWLWDRSVPLGMLTVFTGLPARASPPSFTTSPRGRPARAGRH